MVMKFLRKRRTIKIVMWATAIAVIPGFLIWGIGLTGAGRAGTLAATVNRRDITRREFYDRLSKTEQRYREMLGDKYDEFAKHLNLEQSVLDEMIREKILETEGARRRVKVTDAEVLAAVRSDPVFKDEKGNFSQQRYDAIISNLSEEQITEIEKAVRKAVFMQKLREKVLSETSIQVSDGEIDEFIAKTPTAKDAERETLRQTLRAQKEDRYFRDWMEGARSRAKVTVYLDLKKEEQGG